MHALTLNAGSSSLKFGLFDISGSPRAMMTGRIESIGAAPRLVAEVAGEPALRRDLDPAEGGDQPAALAAALSVLRDRFPDADVAAVGHRIVHGGPDHAAPVALDEAGLAELERLAPFAPLHQPHNVAGVRAAMRAFPEARQIACFDTAFHRGQPWVSDAFALPRAYYDKGVRRYGFHGLSYEYIASELARVAPHLHAGRTAVVHLGAGASMCALKGGRSVGSSMGFSALDGLPMGTRCGQIDPGVLLYLMDQEAMSSDAIAELLYRKSGLLGLSGLSGDMRTLEASDAPEAAQAIDYFVFRIRRELGAVAAMLEGLDGIVFCGGIGENSSLVRGRVCAGLGWLGVRIDEDRNARGAPVIGVKGSPVELRVIPTNEEIVIARAARAVLGGR